MSDSSDSDAPYELPTRDLGSNLSNSLRNDNAPDNTGVAPTVAVGAPVAAGEQMSAGRQKLQSWLYRHLRVQLTDGRILKGNFLCTDADANVILGMCMEDTEKGGEQRMLGLVMVPGRHIVKMEMEEINAEQYK